MSDMRSANTVADRMAIALLAAVAIVAALTFRNYGLGWDDYTHSQYGDLLLKLYGSGFADTSALSFVNLYKYGGGFDMAAALAAKVLPFGLFETRRLIGAAVGIIGLFATWRLGRRLGGPIAGLSALALLATCPLYYGHMFMNAKDAPFATAMIVLLLGLVHAFDEYPQPGARSMVLTGVGLGAAFGSRILAIVAAPYVAIVLMLVVIEEARTLGLRNASARLGQFIWTLLPALAFAYMIMGLLWPWSIVSPLNPLRAVLYFDDFFEKPWKELYEGVLVSVPDMPATYVPHLFVLKLPLILLALGLAGAIGSLIAVVRRGAPLPRRASLLIITLAAILPIVIAMITRPALYNGLRHFVFLVPPFAVLGGLAAAGLIERARAQGRIALGVLAAVFTGGITLPVIDMVRLHPYQYAYFNPLAGGVHGADGKYMLDYWGLAFKQASDALRAKLEERHEQRPGNRRWLVAVCGPQPPARVALGPEFETTAEPRGADFAMSLGTFYCRDLKTAILAAVKREGVVFARVYDIRGQNVSDLLALPPP
ncbi:MAG TPA: glycosyltransferase family 39 protein [Pseudolabrys sp.]|jgi:4-amino-4-deoxy-L-arabinose transferase-like glycosyltransferase